MRRISGRLYLNLPDPTPLYASTFGLDFGRQKSVKMGQRLPPARFRAERNTQAQAGLANVEERCKEIMKLGKGTEEKPGDCKAVAWSLERTHVPSSAGPSPKCISKLISFRTI